MKIVKAPEPLKGHELGETSVRVPKQFPWKLLSLVMEDLCDSLQGISGSPSAFTNVILKTFRKAIRGRNQDLLYSAVAMASPRSMLSHADAVKYNEFFTVYQIGALLKKYPFEGADTATPAFLTFQKFERSCLAFNRENYKALVAMSERHPDFLGIIEELREDIASCIGASPNVQLVIDCAQHGPGTAQGLRGDIGEITTYYKWLPPYSVSPECIPYAKQAILSHPQWVGALMDSYRETIGIPQYAPISMEKFWDYCFEEVECCKYASVPKTGQTDRSIAIEPTLNVYFQLGVDRIFRSRLRNRWGINLNSQELNQVLAHDSSKDNESCTIDLEGASETVTMMLCTLLLPEGWMDLLMDLRSKRISIDGVSRPLHKMSAMGNGFTFALESLIFSAIVRAAMRRTRSKGRIAVFGDDIVIPRTAVAYCLQLLSLCGFSVNIEKSFIDGPFRESCGRDYYLGQNVRPFFLKTIPENITHIWYIYNSLYNLEKNLPWAWNVRFPKTRRWLRSFISQEFTEIYGPPSESMDSYLFSDKPIHRVAGFMCVHPVLLVRAHTFNRKTKFFFRRLMVSHKPSPPPNKWEELTMTTTGSAFDVTKRGKTKMYLSVRQVWL